MERLIRISLELAQEFGFISKDYYRSNPNYEHRTSTVVVDADELDNRATEHAKQEIEKQQEPLRPLGEAIEELTGFDSRYYKYETEVTRKTELIKMTKKEKEEEERKYYEE